MILFQTEKHSSLETVMSTDSFARMRLGRILQKNFVLMIVHKVAVFICLKKYTFQNLNIIPHVMVLQSIIGVIPLY